MSEYDDSGSTEVSVETDDTTEVNNEVSVTEEDVSEAFNTMESSPDVSKETEPLENDNKNDDKPSFDTLSDKTKEALGTPVEDRTWVQTERADAARHPEYETQKSFTKDNEGNIVEANHGQKGSHRPDGIRTKDDGTYDIREDKDYHNKDSLMQNMANQAADRFEFFGEDTELTFAIAANEFTVEEAAQIQDYVENELGANVDWITK